MHRGGIAGEKTVLGNGVAINEKSLRRLVKEKFHIIGRITQSPLFNVLVLVTLIISVFGGVRLFRERHGPAQLSFVERSGPDQSSLANADQTTAVAPEIFSGEVYTTAVRLRETAALGIAMSLAVFAEYSEKASTPATLGDVLTSISKRNLSPPAFVIQNGEISSPSSTLLVRYQAQPLRFEILSHPKPGVNGPALMLRFPIAAINGQTISYFQSSIARRYDSPQPFAAPDQITADGWTLEQWRGELLPLDKDLLHELSEERSVWNTNDQKR